jgi:tetratricopeptide (TPR) repeat protein
MLDIVVQKINDCIELEIKEEIASLKKYIGDFMSDMARKGLFRSGPCVNKIMELCATATENISKLIFLCVEKHLKSFNIKYSKGLADELKSIAKNHLQEGFVDTMGLFQQSVQRTGYANKIQDLECKLTEKNNHILQKLELQIDLLTSSLKHSWLQKHKDQIFVGIIVTVIGGLIVYYITKPPSHHAQNSLGNQSPNIVAGNGSTVDIDYNKIPPEILDRLESANIEIGKRDQVIEELKKKSLAETKENLKERGLSKEALAKFEAGEYAEAEAIFNKELKGGKKKWAQAAYYLGNIKLRQKKLEDSLKYYQMAIKLEPKDAGYLMQASLVCRVLGKYQQEIDYLEQVRSIYIAIDREKFGGKRVGEAAALMNLGNPWYDLGEYEKALELFQEALFIYRDLYGEKSAMVTFPLRNLVLTWIALKKYDKAREYQTRVYNILLEEYGENNSVTKEAKKYLASIPK